MPLALIGSSLAFMLSDYQNKQLNVEYPFDIIIISDNTETNFAEEEALIKESVMTSDIYKYSVYHNRTRYVSDFLYQSLNTFSDRNTNPAMAEEKREVDYYEYDTFMGITDYNCLRKMLGLMPVGLQDNQYLIHLPNRVYQEIKDKQNQMEKSVNIGLSFVGYKTEGFAQAGHNGADYIKVGSEELFLTPATIQVKSREVLELKFLMSSLSFPLFYIGLVFLLVSLTVLSVQQLSDTNKYKFRYQILYKVGVRKKRIKIIVAKQLFFYYLCPIIISVMISAIFVLYTGRQFVNYTGIHTMWFLYFCIALVSFLGIYLLYFVLTYIQFTRSIKL